MNTAVPVFGNTGQAAEYLRSAAQYLASADYPDLPARVTRQALLGMETAGAALTAARAKAGRAFDAGGYFESDGQASMKAWWRNTAKATTGESRARQKWGKRLDTHPVMIDAMGQGVISGSWAEQVMGLTRKIPAREREYTETIIADLAAGGSDLPDLLRVAAEAVELTAEPDDDDKGFTDRNLKMDRTLDGAGVIGGHLTPECAAAADAVLTPLAAKKGKDDHRTAGERLQDAFHEAMLRLLGTGLLPKRDGHPAQAIVNIALADLLANPQAAGLISDYGRALAAQWAGHRAAAAGYGGGDGGAWLAGPAATAMSCDAALFPIVTGTPDLTALDQLLAQCVTLDKLLHPADAGTGGPDRAAHARITELMRQIIGSAAALLSGPGGLAAHLRQGLLSECGLGGASLVLDLGDTDEIPWHLRRAVYARDQHCRWPGGCDVPAAACQCHHLIFRKPYHGPTSITNITTLCTFHHLVAVHRWGWVLARMPDGTLQATSPDGTTVYTEPSRPPPARPG